MSLAKDLDILSLVEKDCQLNYILSHSKPSLEKKFNYCHII